MFKYKFIFIINAIVYLSLPLFAMFPGIVSSVLGIPFFEGVRLDNFRNLMLIVAPLGIMYVLAVIYEKLTFLDLTIAYRLLWVGPILIINWLSGHIETSLAFCMAFADVLIPLGVLAIIDNNQIKRLKEYFKQKHIQASQKVLFFESIIGGIAILVGTIAVMLSSAHGYVTSFVVSIFAIYYFCLLWFSFNKTTLESVIGITFLRLVVLGIILFNSMSEIFAIKVFTSIWIFGNFSYLFSALWETAQEKISIKKWFVLFGISLSFSSTIWYFLFYLFTFENLPALAWNVYRQDLMISAFLVLFGILSESLDNKASKHVSIISWLLPFSSIWFTSSTKLLVHLEVGTPFHPSWAAKELAPVWGGSIITDINFSMATLFLTAISTTYVALVVLRYLSYKNWLVFSWHGIAIILFSSLWMIVSSSGLPAPTESMNAMTIAPFFPVDPIQAVSIHVYDIFIGILMVAIGLTLNKRIGTVNLVIYIVPAIFWISSVYPKILAHI